MIHRAVQVRPDDFWPLPGEVSFPAGQTAAGLQELIADPPGYFEPDRVERWLDTAWEEGLDPETVSVDEPWAAVLSLEVARRDARANWIAQREAQGYELGPERPDTHTQVALADDLIAAWPDHPAGDYARLYRLLGMVQGETEEDEDDLRSYAVDLLRHSSDALVVREAIGVLRTRPHGRPLTAEDLDRLAMFSEDFPELVVPVEVTAFALDQALARNDAELIEVWLRRYRRDVASWCAEEMHTSPGSSCAVHRNNLDEAVAYAGGVLPSDAETWQQAFEIAGFYCMRAGHAVLPLRTLARWRGGWSWPELAPTEPFHRCFVEQATSGPTPSADALDVQVAVIE